MRLLVTRTVIYTVIYTVGSRSRSGPGPRSRFTDSSVQVRQGTKVKVTKVSSVKILSRIRMYPPRLRDLAQQAIRVLSYSVQYWLTTA